MSSRTPATMSSNTPIATSAVAEAELAQHDGCRKAQHDDDGADHDDRPVDRVSDRRNHAEATDQDAEEGQHDAGPGSRRLPVVVLRRGGKATFRGLSHGHPSSSVVT